MQLSFPHYKPAISLLLTFLFLLALQGKSQDSAATKIIGASFQSKPLIIDGKDNDWPAVLPYSDAEAGIHYSISNDDAHVYICLKANDEIIQAKILRAGLTVYIDRQAKKKQGCSIAYPLPVEDEAFPAGQQTDLKTMEAIAFMHAGQYRLSGFSKGNGVAATDQNNEAGLEVKIGFNDKGQLLYEAAIPFSAFYEKAAIAKDDIGKSLAIGFSINALAKPMNQDINSRRTSVDLSRQFFSTGNPPPNSRKMEQLYVKTKTWKLISLTLPSN